MTAPVYGLVLAGGASSRMKRDKAALLYQGRSQLDRAYALAQRHCAQVFVSVRADQIGDPARAGKPLIVDAAPGSGPIVGIRSALAAHPDVAWLVLACDLPFLSDAAIEQLLAGRDSSALATAYRSSHDGLPEPLCAVWEPAAAAALDAADTLGAPCPRKFLIRNRTHLLEPLDPRALDNINTPQEYAEAVSMTDIDPFQTTVPAPASPMLFKIQYFALLREQAGRSEETLETAATTPSDLYAELKSRYGFSLARDQLKVAVNSEFSDWSRPLAAGDSVVFIPPVAGG